MRSSRCFIMFRTGGRAYFHMMRSSTTNAAPPQMISFVAGRIRLGAFWQSSMLLPASSFLMHSSSAVPLGLACATAGVAITPSTATAMAAINNRIRMENSLAADDECQHEAEERQRLGERDSQEH